MDVSNSDADFDSYWEDEARNPNRNRIRIGRQYQATVPPLLKSGENDGRKLEELETLRWRPDNELSDDQLDQYLSVAKAVSLFARAIDNNCAQNIDSQIENNDTASEVPDSSTENNEKTKTTNDSAQTQSVNDIKIQSALKGLSEFVTSHHPGHHDIGCRVPIVPQKYSHSRESDAVNNLSILLMNDWTASESQLFIKAISVCGKNFGAIKKDFLPWKSVKSIIEYYYLKGVKEHRDFNDNNSTDVLIRADKDCNEEQSLSANFLNRNCETISNSPDMDLTVTSASDFMQIMRETERPDNIRIIVENQKSAENLPNNELKRFTDDTKIISISGQEVKPLKAKPILPSAIQESLNNVSTVGSLKFYLDGQLVLKLNAQQEMSGQKCQWIESSDTAKRPRPLHKANKILLIDRQDAELHSNSNNHKCLNSEDGSADSSDNDSMESNESAIIPSPSSFIAKKARVKIENSCNIPLASPTATQISVKDQQRLDLLNQCNKSVKIENSSAIKRENTSSITNFLVSNDDERKRKNLLFNSNDYLSDKKSYQSCLDNKWYHTMIEKQTQPQPPPKAHSSSSTLIGQMHRSGHSRYDANLQTLAPTASSSSSSSTSTHTSSSSVSASSLSISSLSPSFLSNAIPVDLTRKSTSCSPLETKSSHSTSSTPNSTSYIEKDKNSKSLESPSPPPPRLQPPYVFPYPPYLPHSPTQSQSKSKKDVKSSNNMCQKAEGRSLKLSPPDLPSSIPATQPLPSQLAWLQNSLVSYLPIYEQYYRYYYGYGMPPINHSSDRDTGSRSDQLVDTAHSSLKPRSEMTSGHENE